MATERITKIEAGESYLVRNQGMSITPLQIKVTVVWINEDAIWYRIGGGTRIEQTTLERFFKIINQ